MTHTFDRAPELIRMFVNEGRLFRFVRFTLKRSSAPRNLPYNAPPNRHRTDIGRGQKSPTTPSPIEPSRKSCLYDVTIRIRYRVDFTSQDVQGP